MAVGGRDLLRWAVSTIGGVNATGYSSHSLRAGLVTDARAHRVDDALIMRHTGHANGGDNMLNVYDRPQTLLERTVFDEWWRA